MPTVISVENLSKKYLIDHQKQARHDSLRDVLTESTKHLSRKLLHPFTATGNDPGHEEFWALRDVSFDIRQGDRVGIIGRNGAGKSTLLKILSRITEPTAGRASIKGRVASLLEVGTGFHPELSGRENIFLNGAILGMSKAEIKQRFDEIVAFAEVEKFLDTPVKRYSSGMYVRLAFAVAAHLEPEILIVDEVLAVGDAQFQKKCLGKMQDVSSQGRTILFVSHNMAAVSALCSKGILLQQGRIAADGAIDSVLAGYMQANTADGRHLFINKSAGNPGDKAAILEAGILGPQGEPSPSVLVDQAFLIQLAWRLNVEVPFLRLGIEIIDASGVVVLSSMDTDTTGLLGKSRSPGIFHETVTIPPFLLMPGNYSVKVFAGIPRVERLLESENLLGFEVLDNHTHLSHVTGSQRAGYISTPLDWQVRFDHVE